MLDHDALIAEALSYRDVEAMPPRSLTMALAAALVECAELDALLREARAAMAEVSGQHAELRGQHAELRDMLDAALETLARQEVARPGQPWNENEQ